MMKIRPKVETEIGEVDESDLETYRGFTFVFGRAVMDDCGQWHSLVVGRDIKEGEELAGDTVTANPLIVAMPGDYHEMKPGKDMTILVDQTAAGALRRAKKYVDDKYSGA